MKHKTENGGNSIEIAAIPPSGLFRTDEDAERDERCKSLSLPVGVKAPPDEVLNFSMIIVDHDENQRTFKYCRHEWPSYHYLKSGAHAKKVFEPTVQILKSDVLGQFEKYFIQINWSFINYYKPTPKKQERLLVHLASYSTQTYYGEIEVSKGYEVHKCGEIIVNKRIEVETNWLPLVDTCRLELTSAKTYVKCG